jgi:hypothetical protein
MRWLPMYAVLSQFSVLIGKLSMLDVPPLEDLAAQPGNLARMSPSTRYLPPHGHVIRSGNASLTAKSIACEDQRAV